MQLIIFQREGTDLELVSDVIPDDECDVVFTVILPEETVPLAA